MRQEDFEYAIKKDIRNNPIVREIDQARQQEFWKAFGIVGLLVGVVLFSAWQHFELLQHGYRIQDMEQERARELEINRHLRLEIETLRSPTRIERIATEKLDLVAPTEEQAVVIERVVPSPEPHPSIRANLQEVLGGRPSQR